jgi:RHS repeat-associated protein
LEVKPRLPDGQKENNMKSKSLILLLVVLLIVFSQKSSASISNDEIELGRPRGEYFIHFGSDPVNLKNGNLYYPVVDVSIPCLGFPLEVKRSYNSRSQYKGIFGFGWSSNLDLKAEVKENHIAIFEEDGFREKFILSEERGGVRHFRSSNGPQHIEIQQVQREKIIMSNHQSGEKRIFDHHGRILSRTDRFGNTLKFSHDSKGHLLQVQDIVNRSLKIETDTVGQIVQITDPIGRTIRYEYDKNGDLTGVTDRAGHKTSFEYDNLHNLIRLSYPNGGQTRFVYDTQWDLITEESGPEGRKTTYRYRIDPKKPEEWTVTVIDTLGNTTSYNYSGNGSRLVITDPMGRKTIKETCPSCGGGLSSYTDAKGNTTHYKYETGKGVQVITQIDPLGRQKKEHYDEKSGRLLKEIAPNGGVTERLYDNAGNLVEVKDALGNMTRYRYLTTGLLAEAVDSRGGITKLKYDTYGNLISKSDPSGSETKFAYDLAGRLIKTIDPLGNTTTTNYTQDDHISSIKDPVGYTLHFEYDTAGLFVKVRDSNSVISSFAFNQAGDLLQTKDALNNTRRFEYDSLGRMVAFTNTRGFTSKSLYDALGREVETTDPMGNKETRDYDAVGNLVRLQKPGGDVTVYEYDVLNRMVKSTNPIGSSTSYSYDISGNIVQTKDEGGNISKYRHDLRGRLREQVDSLGRQYKYEYDEVGSQIADWNPLGLKTEYVYDLSNRLTKAIYPGKGELHFKYDAAGNPIESKDLLGRTRHLTYDARSQLIQIHDYDGQVRTYKRDLRGNPVELTIKSGPTMHFSYDALNQIVKMVGPAGRTESYTFDGESNLLTSIDGKGRKKTFSYNPLNRLAGIRYPDGTGASYSYDAAGNLVNWKNDHSDVQADYGPMRTMRSISYKKPNIRLSMKYDKWGNLSAIILPDGREIQRQHDSQGRLQRVALGNGPSVKISHDKLGRAFRREYSNGLSQFIEYTPSGRTSSIRIGKAQSDYMWERSYKYDSIGNLMEEFDGDQRFRYFYDNDRLSQADLGTYGILKLAYDDLGNRILNEWAGKSEAYKYNPQGQLIQAGSETFQWDDRGNLIERKDGSKTIAYGYNGDNQLTSAKADAGNSVSYTYDALGNLIGREDGLSADHMVQVEGVLFLVTDQKGTIKECYVSENTDRPLFSQKGGVTLFHHQDLLDNVSLVTNVKGAIVEKRAYSPFGIILSGRSGPLDPAYGARPTDPVAQLYNMRFRYYDPNIGLFTSQDPLFNNSPYMFAQNNPLRFKDPFGLLPCEREAEDLMVINWRRNKVFGNLPKTEEMIRESSARLKEEIEKLEELKGGWTDFIAGFFSTTNPPGGSVSFYQGKARMYQAFFNVGIPVVALGVGAILGPASAASAIGRLGVGVLASGSKDIASSDFGVMSPSAMVTKLRSAEAGLKLKIDKLRSYLKALEELRDKQQRELAELEDKRSEAREKYLTCVNFNIQCGVNKNDIAKEFP